MVSLPIPITGIKVDEFWDVILEVRTVDTSQSVYSTLLVLIRTLLAFPAINLDNERCFSMIREMDPEDRTYLACTTMAFL